MRRGRPRGYNGEVKTRTTRHTDVNPEPAEKVRLCSGIAPPTPVTLTSAPLSS